MNGLGHRHLNYAQQLQLTVDMLNVVEELSIQIPTMVSFDFPWAERLAGAVGGIHPLQVADSLLRQGVRVSHIGLEINLDYGATGSAFRDPLQWIDLVDIWTQLGRSSWCYACGCLLWLTWTISRHLITVWYATRETA